MKIFYTYLWLREDGMPYYVGKGCRVRAYKSDHSHNKHRPPKDKTRIIVQEYESEQDALLAECLLIAHYGRKNNNTGILINLTDGGGGVSGWVPSEKWLQRRAEASTGVVRCKDLTGMTFGWLRVNCRGPNLIFHKGSQKARWYCECKCGARILAVGTDLRGGKIKSCGCMLSIKASARMKIYNYNRRKNKNEDSLSFKW